MSSFKLRPHHLLCIGFFEGKGYSSDFTANMANVISALESSDPLVEIVSGADDICRSCPNNSGKSCLTEGKVRRYDNAVLELCGITCGAALPWSELSGRAHSRIVSAGRLPDVCGDCKWFYICKNH